MINDLKYKSRNSKIEKLECCPICNSTQIISNGVVHDTLHYIEGEFEYAICKQCDLRFLRTRPKKNFIDEYYPKQYYTHSAVSDDITLKENIIKKIYDIFYKDNRRGLNYIIFHLLKSTINMFPEKSTKNPTLLDFGCGNGKLLKRFSQYGFITDGYEVDSLCIKSAKKYARNLFSGSIKKIKEDKKYDNIILNQVLEHLHDPLETMKYLKNILTEDGLFIVSVPNSNCIDFRILKDCWYGFQAPTHLSHYNIKSLKKLSENCSLSIIKYEYSTPFKAISLKIIKKNLLAAFKMFDVRKCGCIIIYLLSLPLVFIPFLRSHKSDRITVYMKKDQQLQL